MKNKGKSKIRSGLVLALALALVPTFTGCTFSANTSREIPSDKMDRIVEELNSLTEYTGYIEVSASGNNVSDSLVNKLSDIFTINDLQIADSLVGMHIDIEVDRPEDMVKTRVSSDEYEITLLYHDGEALVGIDAIKTIFGSMGISESDLDSLLGDYKYIGGDSVEINGEELADIPFKSVADLSEFGDGFKVSKEKTSEDGTTITYYGSMPKGKIEDAVAVSDHSDDIDIAGAKLFKELLIEKHEESKTYKIITTYGIKDEAEIKIVYKIKAENPNIEYPKDSEILYDDSFGNIDNYGDTNDYGTDDWGNVEKWDITDFEDTGNIENNTENKETAKPNSDKATGTIDLSNPSSKSDGSASYTGKLSRTATDITKIAFNYTKADIDNELKETFNSIASKLKSKLADYGINGAEYNFSDDYKYGSFHVKETGDSDFSFYMSEDGYGTLTYREKLIDKSNLDKIIDSAYKYTGVSLSEDLIKDIIDKLDTVDKDYLITVRDYDERVTFLISKYKSFLDNNYVLSLECTVMNSVD